jgi:hypothetical protein
VEFSNPGKSGDRLDIGVVQGMTGVESHARLDDGFPGPSNLGQPRGDLGHLGGSAMLVEGVRIRTGVDLADREAALGGGGNLTEVRIDEC